MPIAVDFGTCNTVIARWNEAGEAVDFIRLDTMTRRFSYRLPGEPAGRDAYVIPSLIHYGGGDSYRIGAQVEDSGLIDHRATFRWVKLDMLRDNRKTRRINSRLISYTDAATDLLRRMLLFAKGSLGGGEEALIVTVPVEAYDHYVDWIRETAISVFTRDVRILDEATACILGYGGTVRDGDIYVIFDFGGGTLDVSVVRTNLSAGDRDKCRVLGRAGEEVGGILVDKWMMEDLVKTESLSEQDIRDMGTALLKDVEDAKIALSSEQEHADITRFNDMSGKMISHTFTRKDLARILDEKGLTGLVARTVERAVESARDKYGIRKSQIRGVFMVGGTSLLLGVPKTVRTLFPDSEVRCDSPFESIAGGACRYAGQDLNPTLVHDYGLSSWDRGLKEYRFVEVVPRGTQYPTEKPVTVKYLNGACDGADCLKIVIYERSYMVRPEGSVIIGSDGRIQVNTSGEVRHERVRVLNPENAQSIVVDPPCDLADNRRFIVGFGVDKHKRLTVSLKDTRPKNSSHMKTRTGEVIPLPVKDFPIVRL